MNLKKIFILLAILIVLIVGIFISEKKEQEKAKKEGVLLELDPAKVSKIELIQGSQKIIFEKKDQLWSMVEPLNVKADKIQIDNIIDEYCRLRYDREVENEARDLSNYGLDKPQIQLKLYSSGADAPLIEYQIGNQNKFDNSYYLKTNLNSKVVSIAEYKKNYLAKEVQDYRDKKFLTIETQSLKTLSLDREKESFFFEKKNDRWWLTRPILSLAAQHRMEDMLFKLNNLEAKSFKEKADSQVLEKYGFLAKPVLTITYKTDRENKIFLVKKDEQLFCYTPDFGEICEIDKDFLTPFSIELKEFRENRVLRFNSFEIEKINFQQKDKKFTLIKDDQGNWQQEKSKTKISSQKVNEFLSTLENLYVADYEDQPREHNFDVQIELFTGKKDSNPAYKLQIASQEKDKAAIKVEKLPYNLLVESSKLENLPESADSFKEQEKKEEK